MLGQLLQTLSKNSRALSCAALVLAAFAIWRARKSLLGRYVILLSQAQLRVFELNRPRRIILIRHAESQGNANRQLYSSVPDHRLEITELGVQQALETGRKLKELVGHESCTFFISPFTRARQTFDSIVSAFPEKQFIVREDPRLREQEFGNYQDPAQMASIEKCVRSVCSLFYPLTVS